MNALPAGITESNHILLFDGVCVLCSHWARFLLRHDRRQRYKLATVQSPVGQALLEYAGLPTDVYRTLVLIEGGRVYLRSEAVLRVLTGLGYPWKLMGFFYCVPRLLRDGCYDRIALNRYRWFGKTEQCFVPGEQDRQRFL